MLSVPTSSAFPERVISIMEQVWTKVRNLMEVDLVKAELFVVVNFNMTCSDFMKYAKCQPKIVRAVKSSSKYSFKNSFP